MKSIASTSYKFSHTAPTKGAEYEQLYETNVWQGYLWQREQSLLAEVLRDELGGCAIDLLDFACGTGRIVGFLADKVHSATGVDVSESMLSVARQKLPKVRLLLADITESPALAGRKFDLITAFRFFTNAEPPLRRRIMGHLATMLKDDGVLVFNNHQNAWAPYPLAALLRHRLNRQATNIYRVMSPLAVRRLCQEAGLEVVRIQGIGLLHVPKIRPSLRWNDFAERWSRRLPMLKLLAQDQVVICRKQRAA